MPKVCDKFADISKTASSVIGDDFQCDGYQFKNKNKINIGGGSAELQVDVMAKGDVQTPTKLTFKFPNTLVAGHSITKFEIDQKGTFKTEQSLGSKLHRVDGLKVEVKSAGLDSHDFAATYTGVADTVMKLETSDKDFANVKAEVLHARDLGGVAAVLGARLEGTSNLCPSAGVSIKTGDLFASIVAKNQFSEFTLHKQYKVSDDIQVAATYQHGGKNGGTYAAAVSASQFGGTLKSKFDGSNLFAAFKKDLAKGTTFLGGMKYNLGNGSMSFGAKVSVE